MWAGRGTAGRTDAHWRLQSASPDTNLAIRLTGAFLGEINDEMIAADDCYIFGASVATFTEQLIEIALPLAPRT